MFAVAGVGLGAAIWSRRDTIGTALAEMRSMSTAVVGALVLLGVVERVTRAGILRRLLGATTFAEALTIHDVGAAASKGVPLGGPLATGLRWSIARDADIAADRFTSALVAYGVATTFVTWMLPFGVLLAEVTQRPPTATDLMMLAVCVVVLGGSTAFWSVVLNSERVTDWVVRSTRRAWSGVGRRVSAAQAHDPAAGFVEVRASLRALGRRPVGLLARTAVAQACGAVILMVALRGVGVGAELSALEFARVYFVVTLLSSFVPVPGGVGVVEAGLTGALVAAGVAPAAALAGVLVYRLLTYVAPIVVGSVLYVAWRIGARRRSRPAVRPAPDVETRCSQNRRVDPAACDGRRIGMRELAGIE
jgi:uncharacterized membrane protein YbhN (UPF0104 family)